MHENMSPEFEARLRDLLAAPDADAEFVTGLRSRVIQGSKVRQLRRFSPRLGWATAIALGLIVVGALVFSPQVVQAMRRLLGYIPGLGYVERGPTLRVLSAPVTVNKDGLTFAMEKGVADSQRTVLLARVTGYPNRQPAASTCDHPPRLVSSDGSVQQTTEVQGTSDQENAGVVFLRYAFEPMAPGLLDATLEIPCLMFDLNYPDWSIPLHFEVAKGTDQVIPVIELPTSIPTQPVPTGAATPAAESAPAGFSIVLKSVAELQDGYVLSGSYQWSDPRVDASAVAISNSNITDANGQDIPYQQVDTAPSADTNQREIPFAYQITGKDFAWPLNIIVNSISVVQPEQGTFEFDPGPNPQAGQTWNVNIDVPVAGHVIHVETIALTAGRTPTQLGFDFTMTSDRHVAGATVEDMNPIINCKEGCGGGGGGGGADVGVSGFGEATGPFYYGSAAEGYSPAGVKTFVISNVSVFFNGPWQVSWQPNSP